MKLDDMHIRFHEEMLTMQGERKLEHETHNGYCHRERASGAFSRSFMIGPAAEADQVEAKYTNRSLLMCPIQRAYAPLHRTRLGYGLRPYRHGEVGRFHGAGTPKGEQVEGLNLEVILSPDEARRGGVLSRGVPVFASCTRCAGTGHTWGVACLVCMGQGMRVQEGMVTVCIPPQMRHGTMIEMPLRGRGLHNLYLCLRIAVTSWG
jgi:hypothetical protein